MKRRIAQGVFLCALLLSFKAGADAQNLGVTITTVSAGEKDEQVEGTRYKVGEKVQVKVSVKNTGDARFQGPKGEDWYRIQLYRNGVLLPYRKRISEKLEGIDRDGNSFRVTGFLSLEPNDSKVEVIDLSYWYPRLKAGQYQLSLERLFFNWKRTSSNVMFFEVVPKRQ